MRLRLVKIAQNDNKKLVVQTIFDLKTEFFQKLEST